jgi:arylsulfatase A-like enzyme
LIGGLVRELERLNLAENTFLVITADHGEAFMEHGYVEHTGCLHNEVLRVPLILSGPGLPRGRRLGSQVRSLDVMPTLLDLCGLAPKAEIQGVSLLPWITGDEGPDLMAASETERGGGQVALTDGRYKVIRKNAENRLQLYDLGSDSGEKNDLADSCPNIRKAMESQLAAWEKEVAACAERYWSDDSAAEAMEMQAEVVARLRDLGYVE